MLYLIVTTVEISTDLRSEAKFGGVLFSFNESS
jgi:hypothetical protein